MLKRVLIISAILLVLVFIGLKFALSSFVSKNFIVAEIEKSINGRVELGSIDVSLLRPSVKLILHDTRVAKKDAQVTGKVLHDDRPLLEHSDVTLKKAYIEVSWKELLSKKLVVKSILIDKLQANMVMYKSGKNSLESIFIKPEKESKNTDLKVKAKSSKAEKEVSLGGLEKLAKEEGDSLTATLEAFKIKNAKLDVYLESASLNLVAENMNLKLIDGVDFEFSELTKLTPTKFNTNGSFQFYSKDKKTHYGKVDLRGDLFGTFINKANGEFKPIIELELELVKGSYLKQIPVLDKLTARLVNITEIPGLNKIIKKNWDRNYKFGKGQTLKVGLNDTTYKLLDPVKVDIGGWKIRLEKGAWFRSTDTEHSFSYHIIADESSSKLMKKALGEVQKIVPKDFREKTAKELNNLFTPEGLFFLSFETNGKLTNPKVKDLSKIPKLGDLQNHVKDVLKNKLQDKLQKELDKGLEKKLKSKVSDFFNKL